MIWPGDRSNLWIVVFGQPLGSGVGTRNPEGSGFLQRRCASRMIVDSFATRSDSAMSVCSLASSLVALV